MIDEPSIGEFLVHDDRVLGMLNDRAVTGFLLNVGLALARLVDFEEDPSSWRIATILDWLYPCPPYGSGPAHQVQAATRLVRVLQNDLLNSRRGGLNPRAALPRHFPEIDWNAFLRILPVLKPASSVPNGVTSVTPDQCLPAPSAITATGRALRLIEGGGEGDGTRLAHLTLLVTEPASLTRAPTRPPTFPAPGGAA